MAGNNKKKSKQVMKNVSSNLKHVSDGGDFYEVVPVDMFDKQAKEQALRELSNLQNELMTDYKNWAREHVKYSEFDGKSSMSRLRETNDDFTLQLLTNCISFQDGITFGALLSTVFTYNVAKISNPSFEQDISRLMLNMRDTMVPELTKRGGLAKGFATSLDKYLVNHSTDLMHNQIAKAIDNNSLDDMVMTPRQLAALKVNFMEQYYVDLHSLTQKEISDTSLTSKYSQLQQQYNTAIKHINAIANNSGFDMSVVAEEERYIVGLNMMENPRYAAMFDETSGVSGVVPQLASDGTWTGTFITRDGHDYNISDSNPGQGSFTVRMPAVHGSAIRQAGSFEQAWQAQYKEEISSAAQSFLDMTRFLENKKNKDILKDLDTNKVKHLLKQYEQAYKLRIVTAMADDAGISYKKAESFFDRQYDISTAEWKKTCSSNNISREYAPEERNPEVFKQEVYYAIDKELCRKMDIVMPGFNETEVPTYEGYEGKYERYQKQGKKTREAKLHYFSQMLIDKNAEVNGHGDTRSAMQILADMQNTYLSTMTEEDLARLLIHANANIEQGHSRYDRRTRPSPLTKSDLDYMNTLNDATYYEYNPKNKQYEKTSILKDREKGREDAAEDIFHNAHLEDDAEYDK